MEWILFAAKVFLGVAALGLYVALNFFLASRLNRALGRLGRGSRDAAGVRVNIAPRLRRAHARTARQN